MAMTAAGNQVKLGEGMYFFKSPKKNGTVKDCLLLGHGGYFIVNGEYAVPTGFSVYFYVEHGRPLNIGQESLIRGPAAGISTKTSQTVVGPNSTYNYSMGKSQGSGSVLIGMDLRVARSC